MADAAKVLLTFAIVVAFLIQTGERALFFHHVARPDSGATKKPKDQFLWNNLRIEADRIWQEYYENQRLQFIYPQLKPLPFCRGLTARIGRVCSPIRIWF